MDDKSSSLFKYDSLSRYSLKQRILIRLADLAFYCFTNILGYGARVGLVGRENAEAAIAAGKPMIFTFWHDSIIMSACVFKNLGIVIMASKSFDGEYIARFVKRMGFGVIRGSSSRGGSRALLEMIRAMRLGHPMAFTIDGPRGPRHRVKPGPVLLAKMTGCPIVPFAIQPRKFWSLGTWDRLQIPRPFSEAALIVGEPIFVPEDADDQVMAAKQRELQSAMAGVTRRREEWVQSSANAGSTDDLQSIRSAIRKVEQNAAEKNT